MNVNPTAPVSPGGFDGTKPVSSPKSTDFVKVVSQQLAEVNQTQHTADQAIADLATGETDNVHDVVLSMAKADLTFRLVLEIRNRLVEAYQEIMRMQV